VIIHFGVPRVHCQTCGLIRQANIRFADERWSYTRTSKRYALELSHLMTIQDTAKRDLSKWFAKPKLTHLKQIAIDEISVGKGYSYLTLVSDVESSAVVFVGRGKGADALRPFWKRLRSSGAKIKAVVIDMSLASEEAVSKHLPKVQIVFDHFHISSCSTRNSWTSDASSFIRPRMKKRKCSRGCVGCS
jgi:transposase